MLIPQVSDASSWEKLWSRPDQQGYRALERGAPEEAAGLFEDPGWKGIAQYRAGNFQEAEKAFSAMNTPEGHYNRGNALANLGHYEEALASYQATLTQQPQHEDARHNMEVIKKLMENSSPPNQEGQQPSPSEPSSSIQKNDGRDDDGEGGEPAQASDSTPGRHSRPSKDGSEGNQEEMEPRTGSKSGQSANPTRSDKDASPSGENVAEETSKLEPSKGEQSEKSMPSASSPEEQPGDEAEKSEVASAASTAEASDMQKSDQALRQWLRRIPDDPGGLLRRKFLLEHQRRIESGRSTPSQGRSW